MIEKTATAPDTPPNTPPVSVESVEMLAATHPDDPSIQWKCGEMYIAIHRMDLALECFRRVLMLCPDEPKAYVSMGGALQALGKLEEAEANYRMALRLRPDMVNALFFLGTLLWQKLDRPAEAVPVLLKLLEVAPQHVEVHRSLGAAYCALEQYDEAILSHRRHVALRPNAIVAYYGLGNALSLAKNYKEAVECFQEALLLDPDRASSHLLLGDAISSLEGVAQAYPHYRRAHALKPLRKQLATTSPAAFSVLLLYAPGAANTPLEYLIGHSDYDTYIAQILPKVEYDINLMKTCANVVINLISDVDQGQDVLAIASSLVQRLKLPVVNPPDKILLTDREYTEKRLSGIPFCRVPTARRYHGSALRALNRLALPFLIRRTGTHNGDSFEKIDLSSDLEHYVLQPEAEYYVIEHIDCQSDDGYFRKYRFMFVGNEIYPYHLAIGSHWKVHHWTTDMADHPWMQHEEEAFLEHPESVFQPKHFVALKAIRKIIGLDFFGVDCGLDREGNLVVFEVNASMLIHQRNTKFPYKAPYVGRIKTAFDAMLRTMALKSNLKIGA